MSVVDEKLEQEENPIDDLLDSSAEAGAEAEADLPNEASESEEPEIDVSTLVDSRSDEERKHNQQHAKERIARKRIKELESQIETMKNQGVTPDTSDLKKPKRTDYLNETALDEKFGGNENLATAAFEDDLDEYNDKVNSRTVEAQTAQKSKLEEASLKREIEARFDEHSDIVKNRVSGFDDLVTNAENWLSYEGSLLIKDQYGAAAPLMLAAIGKDRNYALRLAQIPDQPSLYRELHRLEQRAIDSLSSLNKQSTASAETAVKSKEISGVAAIDKAMKKAADEGNTQEYQRLKAQKIRVAQG